MKNILVTGGAGFIGSNFIRYLLQQDPGIKIINLDKLTYAGSIENLTQISQSDRHTFIQGSICDSDLVNLILEREKIDTIVNFAAETHVDRSIRNPAPFIETNIQGTFTLLEAAKNCWLNGKSKTNFHRFHHISTDEVYGSLIPGASPWKEDAPYQPTSPYAASKAAADHLVRSYHRTYGLPVTLTNCTNNYGPYQFPEKLIPLTIAHAIARLPIPIYGDGKQKRDWLHVNDHCIGIRAALEKGEIGESYHLSSGELVENIELVRAICVILDELQPRREGLSYLDQISFVVDRAGHDRCYALDSGKSKSELGWRAQITLQDGLKQVIEWYMDHPDWLSAIRARDEYQKWMAIQYNQGNIAIE